MKNRNFGIYAFWIAVCEAVGLVSGLLSMQGMQRYSETAVTPALAPPDWLFPIVWTILFALMGIAAARISLSDSQMKQGAVNLFVAQLVVNFFWPLLFFNAQRYGFAFIWLLLLFILVLLTAIRFWQVEPVAGYLLIPYLVWLVFAGYLNLAVFILN